ncbi:transmembrane O-methyltransferase-like [Stigmatopora argus]
MSFWPMMASLPLLPAIVLGLGRHRARAAQLCYVVLTWMLRLLRGQVCATKTHSFVFSHCTHGNANSVLEAFDVYAETHASASLGPQIGQALNEVVKHVRPSRVLELGMNCGYASVLLLRLLPPDGKLLTVEQDPAVADLGEEIILVAGFKQTQFQVLTGSSGHIIPTLQSLLEEAPGTSSTFNLVFMDHDPQQYLLDLQALEKEGLLCPSGCSIIAIIRNQRVLKELREMVQARPECYIIKSLNNEMIELFFQRVHSK